MPATVESQSAIALLQANMQLGVWVNSVETVEGSLEDLARGPGILEAINTKVQTEFMAPDAMEITVVPKPPVRLAGGILDRPQGPRHDQYTSETPFMGGMILRATIKPKENFSYLRTRKGEPQFESLFECARGNGDLHSVRIPGRLLPHVAIAIVDGQPQPIK